MKNKRFATEKWKRHYFAIYAILCSLFICSACISVTQRSFSDTENWSEKGNWDGNVYSNEWLNITFVLPEGYIIMQTDSLSDAPLHLVTYDFCIAAEDDSVIIALTYFNVSFAEAQDETAESYYEKVKAQLANNPNRTRIYPESYEIENIAGTEYLVMRLEYYDHHNPTEVRYQDSYVCRWDDAIVVFIATHAEEARKSIDAFFTSICQLR